MSIDRRGFLKTAGGVGAALGVAGNLLAARPSKTGRVIGANDKIN
nr:twin-arginine translocation signal domain-containing protein [Acidobacteriota bacterium]